VWVLCAVCCVVSWLDIIVIVSMVIDNPMVGAMEGSLSRDWAVHSISILAFLSLEFEHIRWLRCFCH